MRECSPGRGDRPGREASIASARDSSRVDALATTSTTSHFYDRPAGDYHDANLPAPARDRCTADAEEPGQRVLPRLGWWPARLSARRKDPRCAVLFATPD